MSKVSQGCPICDSNFITVMLNKSTQRAWPACWKCGFDGDTKEDKEAMVIDLKLNPMDDAKLFNETIVIWNEYLALLEQEKTTEKEDKDVERNQIRKSTKNKEKS